MNGVHVTFLRDAPPNPPREVGLFYSDVKVLYFIESRE